jgi:hypothetical protein
MKRSLIEIQFKNNAKKQGKISGDLKRPSFVSEKEDVRVQSRSHFIKSRLQTKVLFILIF